MERPSRHYHYPCAAVPLGYGSGVLLYKCTRDGCFVFTAARPGPFGCVQSKHSSTYLYTFSVSLKDRGLSCATSRPSLRNNMIHAYTYTFKDIAHCTCLGFKNALKSVHHAKATHLPKPPPSPLRTPLLLALPFQNLLDHHHHHFL